MKKKKKKRIIRKWKPGDRAGDLFYVSAHTANHGISEFCSAANIAGILRDFLYPILEDDKRTLEISIGIEVYAEKGGHKRVVVGRWTPAEGSSMEAFVQQCKVKAATYKVVYPPTEIVEVPKVAQPPE